MMRLPVDHQRHCILSLLIMPHNAIPDYELPLLHWRFFGFVFSLLAASKNLSQQDAVLLRLQRNPLYVFRDVQERERFLSLSLPSASQRLQTCLLSETKVCSCFHFLRSLLCLNLANIFTFDVPLLKDD